MAVYSIRKDEAGKLYICQMDVSKPQGPPRTFEQSMKELEVTFGSARRQKIGEHVEITTMLDVRELDPESQEPPLTIHEFWKHLEAKYEMPKKGERLYRLKRKDKNDT